MTRFRHFVESISQDIFISSSRSQSLLASPPLLTSALVGSRGWGPCLSLTWSLPSTCQCEMEVKVAVPAPIKSWIGFWGLRGPDARHFSKDKVPVSRCPPLCSVSRILIDGSRNEGNTSVHLRCILLLLLHKVYINFS